MEFVQAHRVVHRRHSRLIDDLNSLKDWAAVREQGKRARSKSATAARLERLRIQEESFQVLRNECTAYINHVGNAVFQQYLRNTYPNTELIDLPLSTVNDASTLAAVAKGAAIEGLERVLIFALLTAPQALRSHSGKKSEGKRKVRGGGRPKSKTPWKLEVKKQARFRGVDLHVLVERLKAAGTIDVQGDVVIIFDATGQTIDQSELGDFRTEVSKFLSAERKKIFS